MLSRRNNLSASCVCTRRCDPTVTPSWGRNVVSTVSTAFYLKRITGPWLGCSYPYIPIPSEVNGVLVIGFGGPVIPNLRRWDWMSRVYWVQIFVVLVFEFEHLKHQHFNFCLGHRCYPSLPNIFYSSTFPRLWVKTRFHPSKKPFGPWDWFDFETWCFDEKNI